MRSITVRLTLVALCLAAASAYLAAANRDEVVPPRTPLAAVPMTIDGWVGRREADLTPDVLKVLGADDYIVRSYFAPQRAPIGLYRLPRDPAPGRHYSLASQLPAWSRLATAGAGTYHARGVGPRR